MEKLGGLEDWNDYHEGQHDAQKAADNLLNPGRMTPNPPGCGAQYLLGEKVISTIESCSKLRSGKSLRESDGGDGQYEVHLASICRRSMDKLPREFEKEKE